MFNWFVITVIIFLGYFGFLFLLDRIVPINRTTKTCLITGASSGIGKAMTYNMVKKGWQVLGIARSSDSFEELEQELGDKFIAYGCDVSDEGQVKKVSDEIKARGLKPTLFFLNAGIGFSSDESRVSTEEHKKVFGVNYFGAVVWVEQWLPFVKEQGGGTFVGTSSVITLYSAASVAAYAASKAALSACFKRLRFVHQHDNIGFALVLPGPVDTALLKGGAEKLPFKQTPKQTADYIVTRVLDGRQTIEPSWIYSAALRLLNWLPERIAFVILKAI